MSTAVKIHGFCEESFQPLKEAFAANFNAGLELGASLALTHRGRTVVDLWAGWADLNETKPWEKDTLVRVYSTTKIAATLSLLMLVDRGMIELDAPVARYWPPFAQGGKGAVTVRDALSHQAGVPGFDPPITRETFLDWNAGPARLAAEPHWFEGRRAICYHYATYGVLIGELIRRVDGRGPRQFYRDEIGERLGADFQMGLTARSDLARAAEMLWPPPPPPPEGVVLRMVQSVPPSFDNGPWEDVSAEDPSGGGFANGRSIARLCAILAMRGEVDGVRYLSPAMVDEASREQAFGACPYLGPISMGLGFGRYHPEFFPAVSPTAIGWGGLGGSIGLADAEAGVSLGYAPNGFRYDPTPLGPRQKPICDALETVLPLLKATAP